MRRVKHRNGIRHPLFLKQKALELRKNGRTHREIKKELSISLGSAHLWTKCAILTPEQKKAIFQRMAKYAFPPERRAKLRSSARINLAKYREKYTKKDLLNKIINFHMVYGRIPIKREFNMFNEYKRRFGSWNNAIRMAGFKTNPQLFAYKFIAKDGHNCDSFTEKIIDDWLLERKIKHLRSVKYGNTKLTADFFIEPNIILEFFGLAGVQSAYDEIIRRKRKECKKLNWKLIEIYPKDIFPKLSLDKLLNLN